MFDEYLQFRDFGGTPGKSGPGLRCPLERPPGMAEKQKETKRKECAKSVAHRPLPPPPDDVPADGYVFSNSELERIFLISNLCSNFFLNFSEIIF